MHHHLHHVNIMSTVKILQNTKLYVNLSPWDHGCSNADCHCQAAAVRKQVKRAARLGPRSWALRTASRCETSSRIRKPGKNGKFVECKKVTHAHIHLFETSCITWLISLDWKNIYSSEELLLPLTSQAVSPFPSHWSRLNQRQTGCITWLFLREVNRKYRTKL